MSFGCVWVGVMCAGPLDYAAVVYEHLERGVFSCMPKCAAPCSLCEPGQSPKAAPCEALPPCADEVCRFVRN